MTQRPLSMLKLSVAIALGLWLGFVAIALTAWLATRYLPMAPLAEAMQPPVTAPPAASQAPERMFEQYQKNLHKQQQQQTLDQARSDPRNLSNPTCQFWLQQDQNAPSDKSRANVLQFCN